MNDQPFTLSEKQREALSAAGNRALNDHYHEDLCFCREWPESCATRSYFPGMWDTSAFDIGMTAVVTMWESMRTDAHTAELAALRAQVAELENYERLSPQQCPKGLHADWLVDSEYAHACPWCRIDDLGAAHSNATNQIAGLECDLSAARARVAELEAAITHDDPCRPCGCLKRFERHAWGCPTLPADDVPVLPQPRQTEDPHDSELHHDYALGRDLPAIPHQADRRAL